MLNMVGRSFRFYYVHFNYYNYYFYAHTYSTTDEATDDVSSVCVCHYTSSLSITVSP